MSDIRKCSNAIELNCPLRHRCYRFMSVPSSVQVWARYDYYANSCNGYWEIKDLQQERFDNREISKEMDEDLK